MIKWICVLCFLGLEYSDSEPIFVQTNQRVEKWCKIVTLLTTKVTVGSCLIPQLIVTIVIYSTADVDSKNDAFELYEPFW